MGIKTIYSVVTKRTVSVRETEEDLFVATDEATGIHASGKTMPIALHTLAEKLEVERIE